MILYRVLAYDSSAAPGSIGSVDYIHHSAGQGRLDNPTEYTCLYLAESPAGAIGESFQNLAIWSDGMFQTPYLPTGKRALAHFSVPDRLAVLDLDDPRNLLDNALRPTQVVSPVRTETQSWALRLFREPALRGGRKWDAIRWWSFVFPKWGVLGVFLPVGGRIPYTCECIEPLHVGHSAVRDAATSMNRRIAP